MNQPSSPPAPTADRARPTVVDVLKSLLLRAVLPALVMFGVLLAVGKIITGPLHGIPAEEGISRWFAGERTSDITPVSTAVSTANDTWWTIGLAAVYAVILLILTRRWWLALVPLLAITVESSIFVPVTQLTGRPRPTVAHLDASPPTSSYPSGHTAASFALYWSLMMVASRIPHAGLRRVVQTVCFIFPVCVGTARLYRGMHHLSDVLIGVVLGVFSAAVTYSAIHDAEQRARIRQHVRERLPA